jgi:murein L,D-transpeptidase YcbB/YkuD
MKYVIFRPYWEVPYSIATKEIRPRAQRDPGYLARNDYELVQGSTVVPASPAAIAALGRGVRVRQTPGPDNALGRVKFMLPNPYSVYLHDTNAKGRFAAERRDFSHGCIRVSDPVALARHVLRHQPEWTPERIEAAMNAEKPLQVNLERPIPVLVVYATAVAEENGRLHLYPDVYGHDRELADQLAAGYPYD